MQIRSIAAALSVLGLAAPVARADAVLNFGGWTDTAAQQLQVLEAPFTSGGPLVVAGGSGTASVQVLADPAVPMFKSITTAQASGGDGHAESYARLDMSDTLRFTGPTASALVTMSLSWDTRVSGLSSDGLREYDPYDASFMQSWSFQVLRVSYAVSNPAYVPGCVLDGEAQCEPPTRTQSFGIFHSAGSEVRRVDGQAQWVAMSNDSEIGNGVFSGSRTLAVEVPTGQDVRLEWVAFNNSRCFSVLSCDVVTDAFHSDYAGLALPTGYAFTSASGYTYVGPTPVPEPPVWALGLAGLVVVGLRRRQAGARNCG